jgi:Domain of unknown function (DUF1707)
MSELELRAADADRERTAERLRAAAAEGRLSPDELEERLEVALAARTYAQLEAAVADLPAAEPPAAAPARRVDPERRAFLLTSLLLVAIWALTGAGYFWPVWPILGWGVFVVVPSRWLGSAPCRRNASSRP